MLFIYEGIDAAGRRARGRRDADDEESLVAALRREGLRDVRARTVWSARLGPSRVRPRDLALFTRVFAALLKSTGSPAEALRLLQRLTHGAALKPVVRELSLDVQGGASVADAMQRHPRVFNRVYVNAVSAG